MRPLDAEHTLRLVRPGDGEALARAYARNRAHLEPWEPHRAEGFYASASQEAQVGQCLENAAAGRSIRFVIDSNDGEIRGIFNINNIVLGAFCSADLGYWVDASHTGRGLATRAVAETLDYARTQLDLHRIQAATLQHNVASQRVLAANEFEKIGLAPKYLKIAGEWQDHLLFQRLLSDA